MPAILCFSTVDWDYLWHRPQIVMSHFARDGYRVLYVDTLGLRSPGLGDWPRMLSRLRRGLGGRGGGLRRLEEHLWVHSPLVLPFLNSRLCRRLNLRLLVPRLERLLARMGGGPPILWVYLPTWTVLQCVERIPHRMLVYDCIDALGSNPAGVSRDYAAAEARIVRRADLVLASARSLQRERAVHNPRSYWVPSGVEAGFFAEVEAAAEVERIEPPRIGFFGAVDHRFDLELVRALARAHREWSFVLIGAARADMAALLAEANVHFLGPKPHGELPGYVRALDVLLLPYVVDEFTRHVHPAKIYECLALGKPVVATALPALEEFAQVVRLASGREEFERALREAVAGDSAQVRRRRVELARANSWEARYRQMRAYVEEVRP